MSAAGSAGGDGCRAEARRYTRVVAVAASRVAGAATSATSPLATVRWRGGRAVGLAVGGWLFFTHKAHALSATDTIVLADFTNTTGDAVFDGTLRQGLAVQLEQSPFLSLISDAAHPADAANDGPAGPMRKLTPEIARELCQRAGSTASSSGSIASLGSQYVLTSKR